MEDCGCIYFHIQQEKQKKNEHLSVQSHYCLYIQFEIAIFF